MSQWLPELVLFEHHEGDWERYLEAVYAVFHADFLPPAFTFEGRRVGLKRHPIMEGREATFWHFISEGEVEADRLPDIRRCERIRWPKPMMLNYRDDCVKVWTEKGSSGARIFLWCEEAKYLVVLADRGEFVLPWTAYTVDQDHRKRKLAKRWQTATRKG